ncbi:MAG TPA: amino acid permease [Acidimicrobiales bacterium]|nr:amino acid permease [Acidimicrobiales bacterium]
MAVIERSPAFLEPEPHPAPPPVPESLGYRIKNKLLGPAMDTSRLVHERLGKPTALAVFASDNLSSSAYATEEILKVLVPVVGVAAFTLVVPVTIALLVVLGFLILSYRQTIKAYPSAGGAYIVTRDNFGLLPAQVAGVALLIDYILTVAVSVSAGTAAIASAFPVLEAWVVPISVSFIVLIAYGNLRGVKESGRLFAIPTYFFIIDMVVLLGYGILRMLFGHLPVEHVHAAGMVHFGQAGTGLLMGAAIYKVLTAFANGGAAVTGVEAISNGVPAFKVPEWKNARETLVIMGSTLGAMFLGLSILAARMHVAPFESGTPTVISQIGKLVYGTGAVGTALYLALQAGTALILILAANTSFADFPRLASFHAGDNFMPRQLTKRGHRLVFSNGILALAGAAILLVIVADAKVDNLIGLYAIGVFTSFTLSQGGMARHHLRLKEPGWRTGLFINGTGAGLSLIVAVVIGVTKFARGAWVVIVLVPVMVALLVRLNKQYESEAEELAHDVVTAAEAKPLRRHVLLVFVDALDVAAARAIQYARTLAPDELRAIHFDLDPVRTEDLTAAWQRLGLGRLTLDVVECPDRRITRGAAEIVAEALADGQTEVTVLLPELKHNRVWHRLLHDRTADSIASAIGAMPHVNVTVVPYVFGSDAPATRPTVPAADAAHRGNGTARSRARAAAATALDTVEPIEGTIPITGATYRSQVRLGGRIQSLRVQPMSNVPSLEVRIVDGTGTIVVVFPGRRSIAGVKTGARLVVEGRVGQQHGRLAMINPAYELLAQPEHELPPASH